MLPVLVLLLLASLTSARNFNNPILSKEVSNAAITKYGDSYYLVQSFNLPSNNTFPIFVSKDLQNWESKSITFYIDDWDSKSGFNDPEIHVLNGQFRLYFRKLYQGYDRIFGAYATDILGPYYKAHEPIIDSGKSVYNPSVVDANGVFYMVYNQGTYNTSSVFAQRLELDGLGASAESPQNLLRPSYEWEGGFIQSAAVIQRKDYFYLFYSAVVDCSTEYGIGVARSLYALGPYEKAENPIIVSDIKIATPKNPSIVIDTDGKNVVLLYTGNKAVETCGLDYLCAKTVSFDKNDWPYVS